MKEYSKPKESQTPEYRAWTSMRSRCYYPRYQYYEYYGGRGISVCDAWRDSYFNFLNDMGRRPSPQHSLDRIDTNGNYEPANCRWATHLEQAQNQRTNTVLVIDGEAHCLTEWARITGLSRGTIYRRMRSGALMTREQMLGPGGTAHGERVGTAKLTTEQVREIKSLEGAISRKALARKYGVTLKAISGILNGTSWRHVEA